MAGVGEGSFRGPFDDPEESRIPALNRYIEKLPFL